MKKKKFASFLISGKLAINTLVTPIGNICRDAFASDYAGCSNDCVALVQNDLFSSNLSIQQVNNNLNPYGIETDTSEISSTLCDVNRDGIIDQMEATSCANPYGIETSALINLPGRDCTYTAPSYINIVLTGITTNDSVYLGLSGSFDDPEILNLTENKVRLSSDFILLEVIHTNTYNLEFPRSTILSINPSESVAPVKVKIQLPDLTSLIGNNMYMQVLSFPNHEASVIKLRVSELQKIMVTEKDCCDPSSNPYCN
ncbi:MAG: hypothetical protein HQK77_00985 [Desulfobacterales bacterium]|nr:hypothetical protein [Desulfobacterales bacterium]